MSFGAKLLLAASIAAIFVAPESASAQGEPATPPDESAQTHWLRDAETGCRAPDPDFAEGDEIVWSGACVDGTVDGPGSLTFVNKGQPQVTITGTFHNGNLQNGRASLAWPDGSKYDGDQIGGKFSGQGVFVSAQQDRLEGEWKDGALNGHATVTWANGNRYDGEWLNGKAEGKGSEVWANGDRYDGAWHEGKAQGQGVQVWANGQTYEGEWRDDQPNGTGKLVRVDGTIFEGKFVNGQPQGDAKPVEKAQAEAPAAAKAAPTAAPTAPALPAPTAMASNASHGLGLDDVEGRRLIAVDGSTISLTSSEGGFTRAITKPDGANSTTTFTFVNDRMGTVADANDPSRVTGLFKMTDSEIDVDYSDGHAEVLRPGAGGVALALRAPDGSQYCMAWYPQGHQFSAADRKAALAQYASRLGVPMKAHATKAAAHPSICAIAAVAVVPATTARPQPTPASLDVRAVPRPMPRPIQASFEMPAAAPAATAHAAAPATSAEATSSKTIIVRTSQVHLIDQPKPEIKSFIGGQYSAPASSAAAAVAAEAAPVAAPVAAPHPAPAPAAQAPAPASTQLASLAPAAPQTGPYEEDHTDGGASACLTVASDGSHWGFKNGCNYSVQFVYCLKGSSEPLAGCKDGVVAGSAAPLSFSALVADGSMQEKNADHQFRWVACGGGAGEVVPKMDGVDPPVGRCLRARTALK